MANSYLGIGNATRGYYDRSLLEHAGPVVVLADFCDKKQMMRHETNVIQWQRSKAFATATVPLTEGVTPDGLEFGYDTVSAVLQEFGSWSPVTTKIIHFTKNMMLGDMAQRQGEQIAQTREEILSGVARAGTRVTYGGRKTTRTAVDDTSTFTVGVQNRIRTSLYNNKAPKFMRSVAPSERYETFGIRASYACVVHTDAIPTLEELGGTKAPQTDHFHSVIMYGSGAPISLHEIGAFRDVRYVASPDIGKFAGAGAMADAAKQAEWRTSGNTARHASNRFFDVYYCLYIGRHALGAVSVEGIGDVQSVLVQPTPQVGDELGRTGWVGWLTWLAYAILNDLWLERLEVALQIEGA